MRQHDGPGKAHAPSATPGTAVPTAGRGGLPPGGQVSPQRVAALQRLVGNAATGRLVTHWRASPVATAQREPAAGAEAKTAEEESDQTHAGHEFGGIFVSTYREAIALLREVGGPLAEHKAFFQRVGLDRMPQEVTASLAELWRLHGLFTVKSGPLDDDDWALLGDWYEAADEADHSGRTARSEIVLGDLLRKREQLQRAQAEFAKMEPALRDLQHRYFLADEPSTLLVVGDAIGEFFDAVEGIKDVALKVETAYDHVSSWRTARTLSLEMSELTLPGATLFEAAGKIKSTYEKIKELARTLDLITPKRTRKQETMGWIVAMGMISDSGISYGQADIFKTSLPLTGYPIGPMIDSAMQLMTQINTLRSAGHNREAIDLKMYSLVDWSNETGGKPMFEFMRTVTYVGSSEQVPDLPEDVTKCFLTNRGRFDAALGGRDPMPTQGLFFTSLHTEKIKQWVYRNRYSIWGSLYGAAQIPG